jgi:hypothetical protein
MFRAELVCCGTLMSVPAIGCTPGARPTSGWRWVMVAKPTPYCVVTGPAHRVDRRNSALIPQHHAPRPHQHVIRQKDETQAIEGVLIPAATHSGQAVGRNDRLRLPGPRLKTARPRRTQGPRDKLNTDARPTEGTDRAATDSLGDHFSWLRQGGPGTGHSRRPNVDRSSPSGSRSPSSEVDEALDRLRAAGHQV